MPKIPKKKNTGLTDAAKKAFGTYKKLSFLIPPIGSSGKKKKKSSFGFLDDWKESKKRISDINKEIN